MYSTPDPRAVGDVWRTESLSHYGVHNKNKQKKKKKRFYVLGTWLPLDWWRHPSYQGWRGDLGDQKLALLKVSRVLTTVSTDPDRVVPAPRGYGTTLGRAVIAHALATRPAVVFGQLGAELTLAVVTAQDVLVRDPVGRPGSVLHQAWGG